MIRRLKKNIPLYRNEIRDSGIPSFLITRLRKISDLIDFQKRKLFPRIFTFQGKNYPYLVQRYNFAWKNERAVEVPIVWEYLLQGRGKKVLEIGNVLSHYYAISHDVVDKYEIAKDVLNADVLTFSPKKLYDLIISISTLEHVGWDEIPQEETKIIPAVNNLKRLLRPGGKIVFTLPLGYYNPKLNQIIFMNKLGMTQTQFLKRVSAENSWQEITEQEAKKLRYNTPFPNANGIVIGIIEKTPSGRNKKSPAVR